MWKTINATFLQTYHVFLNETVNRFSSEQNIWFSSEQNIWLLEDHYIHLQASLPDVDVDCVVEMCCGAVNGCKKVSITKIGYNILMKGLGLGYKYVFFFSDKWRKISPYTCISTKKIQFDFMFMSLNVANEEKNIL